MRTVDYFNRKIWLGDLKLRPGEVVLVEGHQYRYSLEHPRDNVTHHILTPVK